jgi:hypothetical protein
VAKEEGGGNSSELHRLKEGRQRDENDWALVGNNRRRWRSMRAVLGRREKRREAGRGPVKPKVGAHPFIGAGEGHAWVRKGETASGIGLNAIEGGRLNKELRRGIKRGN